ncbi:general secretion pathway protein GspB [Geothermobacter hydrogeniphilus]|uniref:Type II secretion system protein GspB C-terminal domain-containing protein n=1 Tax=Geothermobacter hydrogeniphilus TaxID=1969733 RepID=A0A1X0XLI6_9BACT|nr:general secretion pathway protein GspB [Geothermobacter hydrogeniphilus]ORJ53723.1 hypothetical protein B5V00_16115 [Geothermobacter hydrogeniphilus]
MSYILDSLKKSEQKRRTHHPDIPGLGSIADNHPERTRRWGGWLLLLFFGLCLAGLAVFLVMPNKDSGAGDAFSPDHPPASLNTPAGELSQHGIKPAAPVTDLALPPAGITRPQTTDSGETATAPVPRPEKMEKKLYLFSELPSGIAGNIAGLEMTLHYYSSVPGRSMVRINGRNLHQGEILQPGVSVLQIIPDGAILDLHGYRVWVEKP